MPLSILAFLLLASIALAGQNAPPAPPCTLPQQKQFDFWVGDWDLTWPGTNKGEVARGRNSIRRVLDGCVIQESFDGGTAMPLRGMSVTTFDSGSGHWKQTWVDNQGGYLDFVGGLGKIGMILSRSMTKPDGTRVLQRMVWKNVTADQLDWSWESSTDDGKTWTVQWPIHYQRRH